jgi:hypothetical protein
MVSPAHAQAWQARLAKGETVRLRAKVEAGRSSGAYLIPTAVIPGKDRSKEIVLSCHLDHPSPGANDNASGCAGILEVARSLTRLIAEGKLPQPRRTIRFVWPCEIECTIALLNARPEVPKRTLATIHLDMIGGNTDITHGTLKVEGSPPSLPSVVSDVGFAIGRWVDDQSRRFAERGTAPMPLLDPEGTRNALHAKIGGFSEGSDHQVWAEGSWRVPVIYLADWPDIYIHTQKDVPANLDPTKMKRAIFIAAASAWVLANTDEPPARVEARRGPKGSGANAIVYRRNPALKGPMDGFGYSWLDDHLKQKGLPRPALLSREASEDGPSFGYETLNLVDGRRSVQQIRDALAPTVAPLPVEEVAAYLATLERLAVVRR